MGLPVDNDCRRIVANRFAGPADRLCGWLLPPRCMLCGDRGQAPCLDLCADCERSLPASDPSLQAPSGPLGLCFAPFRYSFPLAHLVHVLKYRGQLAAGRVLGTLLLERAIAAGLQRNVDILLPVPLHPSRHSSRGYNHATEVTRWIARGLGRPLELRLARRRLDTPPQVGLSLEQRRGNLCGAFAANAPLRGLNVTIVDDVTTTGSTLRELACALLDAGAANVDAWCVARADRRGTPAATEPRTSPSAATMR
jgi:ComF family protein